MTRHILLTLLLLCAAQAGAADEQSAREVAYLLQFVAASGCVFTRNGDDHPAADAADHLRLKYARGKRWVDSAEDFIDRLASKSSLSGRPYTVTCQGETEASAQWLQRALARYRGDRTGAD